MNHAAHFPSPQAAYDWASQYFSQGGFRIVGENPRNLNWLLLSNGGFCMLQMSKKWGQA